MEEEKNFGWLWHIGKGAFWLRVMKLTARHEDIGLGRYGFTRAKIPYVPPFYPHSRQPLGRKRGMSSRVAKSGPRKKNTPRIYPAHPQRDLAPRPHSTFPGYKDPSSF